jgi:hypothetical protein
MCVINSPRVQDLLPYPSDRAGPASAAAYYACLYDIRPATNAAAAASGQPEEDEAWSQEAIELFK